MLTPLAALDHETLVREVREQYGPVRGDLRFVPGGEDSWGYRLGDLWVSVRQDLRRHVPAAYELAHRLASIGHSYVLAPVPGADGRIVRAVTGHPVVVFPFVEGELISAGGPSSREIDEVTDMFSRLHSTELVADVPVEDYRLSFAADITRVLAAGVGTLSPVGPYTEPFVRLLRIHAQSVVDDLEEIELLGLRCSRSHQSLVLTHGEPLASNILRTADGLRLLDWGEAGWGPPERDLFHVSRTIEADSLQRPDFARFYSIRWRLSEIAEYGMRFISPHHGDANDHGMWRRLQRYLS